MYQRNVQPRPGMLGPMMMNQQRPPNPSGVTLPMPGPMPQQQPGMLSGMDPNMMRMMQGPDGQPPLAPFLNGLLSGNQNPGGLAGGSGSLSMPGGLSPDILEMMRGGMWHPQF